VRPAPAAWAWRYAAGRQRRATTTAERIGT
jgi:hypothetical protein